MSTKTLVFGYFHEEEIKLNISIPSEIIGVCFEYYHGKQYKFNKKSIVMIQYQGKQNIAIDHDEDALSSNGDDNVYSQWLVEPFDNGNIIKLKSAKSGKYLEIIGKSPGDVEPEGNGDKYCEFKVTHCDDDDGKVKLESTQFVGKYLGVIDDDERVLVLTNDKWIALTLITTK